MTPGEGAVTDCRSSAGPFDWMTNTPSSRVLATVRNYAQLIAVLRARSDELEITREITDAAGRLPSGYSRKLLSRTPVKNLGRNSFGAL
jgi:hypothetical protein